MEELHRLRTLCCLGPQEVRVCVLPDGQYGAFIIELGVTAFRITTPTEAKAVEEVTKYMRKCLMMTDKLVIEGAVVVVERHAEKIEQYVSQNDGWETILIADDVLVALSHSTGSARSSIRATWAYAASKYDDDRAEAAKSFDYLLDSIRPISRAG